MRALTKRLLQGATLLAALALLASYASRWVSPSENEWLPFIGLGFPILLIINLAFLGFWLAKQSRWWILPLLIILIGWNPITDYFGLPLSGKNEPGAFKVLSQNVRLFGFYQWNENEQLRDSIMARLAREKADILCFQEFYFRDHGTGFQTMPYVLKATGAEFIHEKYTHVFRYDQYFGVATMSRHPIVNKGYIAFEEDFNNYCIYSDIVLPGGDTIRVFNTHLASIHFRNEEYGLLEGQGQDVDHIMGGAIGVLHKLSDGFQRRCSQIELVMAEVALSPYPAILCGDFNDTPISYTYGHVTEQLEDAHSGFGLGNTYNGPVPFLRIDHIFYSDSNLELQEYRVPHDPWSDHFPLICSFDLK
jgi:endonuclease/exonuclease/phosphatase family metal-dependent hydrolase